MAGSYGHVVNDGGQFIGARFLENGGDTYEAVEEMYGMIWWLAKGDREAVEEARRNWVKGMLLSPGRADDGDDDE